MEQTTLLIGLSVCHWLADYTHLSNFWMLNAKRLGSPLLPILAHASIHSLLMGFWIILYSYLIPKSISWNIWLNVVLFQLVTHFIIDTWKGKMNYWFPNLQNPTNKSHWIVFGFDQLLHNIVIILMTYSISNN